MHKPRMTKVKKIRSETETIKTIYMEDELILKKVIPGQFLMIWIPGLDEIPMGISHIGPGNLLSITVESVGEATNKLCELKKGDILGIRGPYGQGFSPLGENNLIIGGGSGMAPLVPLIDISAKNKNKIKVILGGKNLSKLPFLDHLKNIIKNPKENFIITTEDGSYGRKGLATEVLIELIDNNKFDKIYAVGPELMIRAVYDIALNNGLDLEVSLERYFKCGIGICGSCCVGPYRVCVEGPVFGMPKLKNIDDVFGHYTRDACGKKTALEK